MNVTHTERRHVEATASDQRSAGIHQHRRKRTRRRRHSQRLELLAPPPEPAVGPYLVVWSNGSVRRRGNSTPLDVGVARWTRGPVDPWPGSTAQGLYILDCVFVSCTVEVGGAWVSLGRVGQTPPCLGLVLGQAGGSV